MHTKQKILGHFCCLFTIMVWGSTFVLSSYLLDFCSPVQLMTFRFFIGYLVLLCIHPKFQKFKLKTELPFLCLGLLGCTLYFLTENTALLYTSPSNVSILVATAPIFTAIFARFFGKKESIKPRFLISFFVAFSGVILVVFNGAFVLKLNPLGDLLAILAALCWAAYSVFGQKKNNTVSIFYFTRKIMFYGLLSTLPFTFLEGNPLTPIKIIVQNPTALFGVLFLGVLASGLCYASWAYAQKTLGPVTANNYIYANPFVTLVVSFLFIDKPIYWQSVLGAVLIISGVMIANYAKKTKGGSAMLEIEHKYLIAMPNRQSLLSLPGASSSKITQTYLASEYSMTRRVRKRCFDEKTSYFYTEKRYISTLSAEETESEITEQYYTALLKEKINSSQTIEKERITFPFGAHLCEVDIYPFWQSQAILEIEVASEDEKIILPDILTILCEVTDDKAYKNKSLAFAIPKEKHAQ